MSLSPSPFLIRGLLDEAYDLLTELIRLHPEDRRLLGRRRRIQALMRAGVTARAYHAGMEHDQRIAVQEAFFGASGSNAIAPMMRSRGIRYVGNGELAESRKKLAEEPAEGPVWIRLGFIDRLIHSTSMLLHRVMEDCEREFEGFMQGIAAIVPEKRPITLLSDHGFSEVSAHSLPRYAHGAERIADTVAAMLVYEKMRSVYNHSNISICLGKSISRQNN